MESHDQSEPVVIWALADGDQEVREALALARPLARRLEGRVEEKRVQARQPYDRAPQALWRLQASFGSRLFRSLSDGGAGLEPPWPKIAVSCGRLSEAVGVALRRRGGVRIAHIGSPTFRASAFDLVAASLEARLGGANVVETVGPLAVRRREELAQESERWRRPLGHLLAPRVAVVVGGASSRSASGGRGLDRVVEAMTRLAVDGATLMVAAPPGAPKGVVDRLAAVVSALGGWVWSGVGNDPYPSLLTLADASLITTDRPDAIIQAAALGLPTMSVPVERLQLGRARLYAALEAHGVLRTFGGELERWTCPPLREAERVAEIAASVLAAEAAAWPSAHQSLGDGR